MSATTTTTTLQQPVALGAGSDLAPLTVVESTTRNAAVSESDSDAEALRTASKLQKSTVTFILAGINFINSAVNGLIIIALPRVTSDLSLPDSLAFWPSSVSGLATASTLLLAGSIADVVGPRTVDLVGCVTSGAFTLGSGFARSGEELVALRALQGVGYAMHLASSIALVTKTLPRGRGRNVAFSCLGLSQPLGFSFGLVVGGVLVETIGWRAGWWLYGSIGLLLSGVGIVVLPTDEARRPVSDIVNGMKKQVDLVGALLASAFMAMICYLLAILSTDIYKVKEAQSIALLCLIVVALPSFIGWVHRQVKFGKPALIPNSLWRKASFTAICCSIALSNAVLSSLELFSSLFFQEVQHLSPMQAAIRILPNVVIGIILNLTTGLFVDKIRAIYLVVISSLISAIAPLLMAVIQPQWPYWANAFLAQALMPFSVDVLFTVGLIVITEVFPEEKHAVAGAVFNTASQFGTAFGMAIMQIVSSLVRKDHEGMRPVDALMEGYRASFWTMLGLMLLCAIIGGLGMRKAGKIGLKTE